MKTLKDSIHPRPTRALGHRIAALATQLFNDSHAGRVMRHVKYDPRGGRCQRFGVVDDVLAQGVGKTIEK